MELLLLSIFVVAALLYANYQLRNQAAEKKRDEAFGGSSSLRCAESGQVGTSPSPMSMSTTLSRRRDAAGPPSSVSLSLYAAEQVYQASVGPLKAHIPAGSALAKAGYGNAGVSTPGSFRPIRPFDQVPPRQTSPLPVPLDDELLLHASSSSTIGGDPQFLHIPRGSSSEEANPVSLSPFDGLGGSSGSMADVTLPARNVPSPGTLQQQQLLLQQRSPSAVMMTGPESLVAVAPRNPLANIARMRYVEVHREKPLQWRPTTVPPGGATATGGTPSPGGMRQQQLFGTGGPGGKEVSPPHLSPTALAAAAPLRRTPTPPIPMLPLQLTGLSSGPPGLVHPPIRSPFRQVSGSFLGEVPDVTAEAPPSPSAHSPWQARQFSSPPYAPVGGALGYRASSPMLLAADGVPQAQASPLPAGSMSLATPLQALPLLAGPPIFGHSPEAQNYAATAALQLLQQSAPSPESRVPPSHFEIAYETLNFGRLIGQGAFGRVYKARWRGSAVAVKMLSVQHLKDDVVADFRAEVGVLSALRHPNILLFMGACTVAPHYCIVTEYLARGSVWSLLHDTSSGKEVHIVDRVSPDNAGTDRAQGRGGRAGSVLSGGGRPTAGAASSSSNSLTVPPHPAPLPIRLVIRMALDVAKGMAYLHSSEHPILHRDLKSGNLLVDEALNIRICDFGLARVKATTASMTGLCGTMAWMSPETLANHRYTEKADVFSYAIVCWELLTRECPFEGMNPITMAMGVLNHNMRPPMPEAAHPGFSALVRHCWEADPNNRPDFLQVIELLEGL